MVKIVQVCFILGVFTKKYTISNINIKICFICEEYICTDDSGDDNVDRSCWNHGSCKDKSCSCKEGYGNADCSGLFF